MNDAQFIDPTLFSKASPCFVIPLTIKSNVHSVRVSALLDYGALACFIDKDFTEHHKLPLVTKKISVPVEIIDGRPLISGNVVKKPVLCLFH